MTTSGQWRAKGAPGSCRTCRAKLGDAHASWCSGGAVVGVATHAAPPNDFGPSLITSEPGKCFDCGYHVCSCVPADKFVAPSPEQKAVRDGWWVHQGDERCSGGWCDCRHRGGWHVFPAYEPGSRLYPGGYHVARGSSSPDAARPTLEAAMLHAEQQDAAAQQPEPTYRSCVAAPAPVVTEPEDGKVHGLAAWKPITFSVNWDPGYNWGNTYTFATTPLRSGWVEEAQEPSENGTRAEEGYRLVGTDYTITLWAGDDCYDVYDEDGEMVASADELEVAMVCAEAIAKHRSGT